MKLPTSSRHIYAPLAAIIGLTSSILLSGCGVSAGESGFARALIVAECDEVESQEDVDFVVLDWDGGISPIYPDEYFDGVALEEFMLSNGGSLADHEESFKEAVRSRIVEIYCGSPLANVVVANDTEYGSSDTVVHLTHGIRPDGSTDIGEGEYDPCNRQRDNAAIIFGERIVQLSRASSFDEWVNVFANVCAHEIGHTLGFGHVERASLDSAERSLFVELMLDRHTMAEMRLPHKFIVDQDNCSRHSARSHESAGAVIP